MGQHLRGVGANPRAPAAVDGGRRPAGGKAGVWADGEPTFTRGIAHDVNNALTGLLCSAEMALLALPADHPATEHLQEVLGAGQRVRALAQQLLDHDDRPNPERSPTDFSRAVREALRLVRAHLPATVVLSEDLAADAGSVLATDTEIYQVVTNLCTNAVRAMGGGGRLQCAATRGALPVSAPQSAAAAYVCLAVRDTGCGMDEATVRRAFEPSFTTKPGGDGTGLGLAVVKRIVDALDGHIVVHSRVGHGSEFRVYLPAAAQTPAATHGRPAAVLDA